MHSLTNIKDVAAAAGVEAEWRIACRAVMRVKLFHILVEAGAMRDVSAGELEDALAAKRMFERLLTDSAFRPHKRPLPPCPCPIGVEHASLTTACAIPQVVDGAFGTVGPDRGSSLFGERRMDGASCDGGI